METTYSQQKPQLQLQGRGKQKQLSFKKLIKTTSGASKKYSDASEEPRTSEISKDLAALEEQQAEHKERTIIRELMFSILKVIQNNVDILKSTGEKLIKDCRALMNEVTVLRGPLREESYQINIMEEKISTNGDQIELQSQKIKKNLSKQLITG